MERKPRWRIRKEMMRKEGKKRKEEEETSA